MDIVLKFIDVLCNFKLSKNVRATLSDLYAELETVDVDLCVPTIKHSKELSKEQQVKMIDLINFYYDNVEDNINYFSCEKSEDFLKKLKSCATELRLSITK